MVSAVLVVGARVVMGRDLSVGAGAAARNLRHRNLRRRRCHSGAPVSFVGFRGGRRCRADPVRLAPALVKGAFPGWSAGRARLTLNQD